MEWIPNSFAFCSSVIYVVLSTGRFILERVFSNLISSAAPPSDVRYAGLSLFSAQSVFAFLFWVAGSDLRC